MVRALTLCMLAYALLFSAWSLALHHRLDTGIFDLGIHVQSMWLFGRGLPDFLTTRGLPTLSDHFTPILYLLAPFGQASAILVLQSFLLASGAYPLYRLARQDLGQDRPALGFALAYLFHPGLWSANLFDFHASALAAPLLLWALWGLHGGRSWLYWCCLTLTLTLGEALGVSVALLSLEAWRCHRRGMALATFCLGIIGLALAAAVMRHFNGGQPSQYQALYVAMQFHPLQWLSYALLLLAPLGFLPLWGWPRLIPALPVILGNLLSWREGQRTLDHHYLATILPFLLWAAVAGWPRWRWGKAALAALLVLNLILHASQLRLAFLPAPDLAFLQAIPPTASVSADNGPGAHLSERRQVYMFPNPFQPLCWGHRVESLVETVGEAGHPPLPGELRRAVAACAVEYLVLRPGDSWPLRPADKAYWLSEIRRGGEYDELPGGVFRRRRPGSLQMPPPEMHPRLSHDGSHFVFERDGSVVHASAAGSERVLGPGRQPDISADGQAVVFVSESSELVAGDDNASADVFSWRAAKLTRHPFEAPVGRATAWWPRFVNDTEWRALASGALRSPWPGPRTEGADVWLGPPQNGTRIRPDGTLYSTPVDGIEARRVGDKYQLFLAERRISLGSDDCLEPCRVGDRLVYTEFFAEDACRVHRLDLKSGLDEVVGEGYNPCLSGNGRRIVWERSGRLHWADWP